LVAARRLLASVKAPPDEFEPTEKTPPGEQDITPWLFHRGRSIWSDDLDASLPARSRDWKNRFHMVGGWTGDPSHSNDELLNVGYTSGRWPQSLFGTLQADRLAETLSDIDNALLSRFL